MKRFAQRASYLCAAAAMGLLALHFNAGQLPGWTRGMAAVAGGLAVAGTALAALALGRHGWTSVRYWPRQVAFSLNALLAIAFLLSANPE